jgi:hypothetical protein
MGTSNISLRAGLCASSTAGHAAGAFLSRTNATAAQSPQALPYVRYSAQLCSCPVLSAHRSLRRSFRHHRYIAMKLRCVAMKASQDRSDSTTHHGGPSRYQFTSLLGFKSRASKFAHDSPARLLLHGQVALELQAAAYRVQPMLTPDCLPCSGGTEISPPLARLSQVSEWLAAELEKGWAPGNRSPKKASWPHSVSSPPQSDSEQRPHKVSDT